MKKYGGFWKRLLAYAIDTLLIYIVFWLIPGVDMEDTWVNVAMFVAWTAYFVWMVGTYGATIGKMVLKLKIVKENGKRVSYSDALLRELASYLSLFVLGIGFLSIGWDPRKQGWHDKIAKTIVVAA
ncbi:RDD family protein [Candidatus Gottesmanbacteria bacterium]|nr:RDD family protein [Candidatus Gottesmanbacteria bacterium]